MASLKSKRVLITGSTGFIGANLARRAQREGAEVHTITRKTSDRWRIQGIPDLNDHIADLSDYNSIEPIVLAVKPDILYHVAAFGGNPIQTDFRSIFKSNITGTANLLKACEKVGFDLFVNTGSSSEYGVKTQPMSERDHLEPVNDYGVSKAIAALFCRTVANKRDLSIVTLRLFSPYGSFEDKSRLIPSVIMACLRGEGPRITSSTFVRDFIYIDDVMDAYILLKDMAKIKGLILNIGTGTQHSVGEVCEQIQEITDCHIEPKEGNPQKWPNEPQRWQSDITLTKKILGWEPSYNLKQGLKASVKWFEENLELYGGLK
jgi:nucleoside-diphosphate-sugar epimerase